MITSELYILSQGLWTGGQPTESETPMANHSTVQTTNPSLKINRHIVFVDLPIINHVF